MSPYRSLPTDRDKHPNFYTIRNRKILLTQVHHGSQNANLWKHSSRWHGSILFLWNKGNKIFRKKIQVHYGKRCEVKFARQLPKSIGKTWLRGTKPIVVWNGDVINTLHNKEKVPHKYLWITKNITPFCLLHSLTLIYITIRLSDVRCPVLDIDYTFQAWL